MKDHWEGVYATRAVEGLSWFEPEACTSLAMIEALELPLDAAIVDVGGGASGLARHLISRGHTDITVIDISAAALERAQDGFPEAERVTWVVGDIREHDLGRRFALWHDRAVFHFMVSAADRDAYLAAMRRSIAPGGHLLLATFGSEGPERCSGLPVVRYSADSLVAALGEGAELETSQTEDHVTPSGTTQQFLFAHLVMNPAG
jgi:ubiquinone/menaquinone biosynthesis C-methylase UbiE